MGVQAEKASGPMSRKDLASSGERAGVMFGATPPKSSAAPNFGMSPMTDLAVSFQTHAKVSSPRKNGRKSPHRERGAYRKSGSHIQRAKYDENALNRRSGSPTTQFG